jgi:hypothetical protein
LHSRLAVWQIYLVRGGGQLSKLRLLWILYLGNCRMQSTKRCKVDFFTRANKSWAGVNCDKAAMRASFYVDRSMGLGVFGVVWNVSVQTNHLTRGGGKGR